MHCNQATLPSEHHQWPPAIEFDRTRTACQARAAASGFCLPPQRCLRQLTRLPRSPADRPGLVLSAYTPLAPALHLAKPALPAAQALTFFSDYVDTPACFLPPWKTQKCLSRCFLWQLSPDYLVSHWHNCLQIIFYIKFPMSSTCFPNCVRSAWR